MRGDAAIVWLTAAFLYLGTRAQALVQHSSFQNICRMMKERHSKHVEPRKFYGAAGEI